MKILGISGSIRVDSYNTALLRAFGERLPEGVEFDIATPAGLPLYDADLEHEAQDAVQLLAAKVAGADGVVIASPEYNHGIPGGLKNLIDWLSRPPSGKPFSGKRVGIMSASPSFVGGARVHAQLKLVLLGVGAELFSYPELLVAGANKKFDGGVLTDETTQGFLQSYVDAFAANVDAETA